MGVKQTSLRSKAKLLRGLRTSSTLVGRVGILKIDSSTSKLAVVVAKKNIPKAVDRNRVKRRIREALRQVLVDQHHPGLVIVWAHSNSLTLPYSQLIQELRVVVTRFLSDSRLN